MDPEKCLQDAFKSILAREWEDAADHLENYRTWRSNGGFEPKKGDKRAKTFRSIVKVCILTQNQENGAENEDQINTIR